MSNKTESSLLICLCTVLAFRSQIQCAVGRPEATITGTNTGSSIWVLRLVPLLGPLVLPPTIQQLLENDLQLKLLLNLLVSTCEC